MSANQVITVTAANQAEAEAGTASNRAMTPLSTKQAIDSRLSSAGNPLTGMITAFSGQTTPAGWLPCNGATVSRTSYAALFAIIGTSFGAGNGTTTFTLPDLRGEFLRGVDAGRGIDPGRALGTAQGHALEYHNHRLRTQTGVTGSVWGIADSAFVQSEANYAPVTGALAVTDDVGATDQDSAGGTWAAETRPRNVAVNFIIKF